MGRCCLTLRREPQLLVLAAGRAEVGDAAAGVLVSAAASAFVVRCSWSGLPPTPSGSCSGCVG